MAGMGETFNHVAAAMYRVEAAVFNLKMCLAYLMSLMCLKI